MWCWWGSSEGERISNGLCSSHAPRMHTVSTTCSPDSPWGPPFKTLPIRKTEHAWPPAIRGPLTPWQVNLLTFHSWVPLHMAVEYNWSPACTTGFTMQKQVCGSNSVAPRAPNISGNFADPCSALLVETKIKINTKHLFKQLLLLYLVFSP